MNNEPENKPKTKNEVETMSDLMGDEWCSRILTLH